MKAQTRTPDFRRCSTIRIPTLSTQARMLAAVELRKRSSFQRGHFKPVEILDRMDSLLEVASMPEDWWICNTVFRMVCKGMVFYKMLSKIEMKEVLRAAVKASN